MKISMHKVLLLAHLLSQYNLTQEQTCKLLLDIVRIRLTPELYTFEVLSISDMIQSQPDWKVSQLMRFVGDLVDEFKDSQFYKNLRMDTDSAVSNYLLKDREFYPFETVEYASEYAKLRRDLHLKPLAKLDDAMVVSINELLERYSETVWVEISELSTFVTEDRDSALREIQDCIGRCKFMGELEGGSCRMYKQTKTGKVLQCKFVGNMVTIREVIAV